MVNDINEACDILSFALTQSNRMRKKSDFNIRQMAQNAYNYVRDNTQDPMISHPLIGGLIGGTAGTINSLVHGEDPLAGLIYGAGTGASVGLGTGTVTKAGDAKLKDMIGGDNSPANTDVPPPVDSDPLSARIGRAVDSGSKALGGFVDTKVAPAVQHAMVVPRILTGDDPTYSGAMGRVLGGVGAVGGVLDAYRTGNKVRNLQRGFAGTSNSLPMLSAPHLMAQAKFDPNNPVGISGVASLVERGKSIGRSNGAIGRMLSLIDPRTSNQKKLKDVLRWYGDARSVQVERGIKQRGGGVTARPKDLLTALSNATYLKPDLTGDKTNIRRYTGAVLRDPDSAQLTKTMEKTPVATFKSKAVPGVTDNINQEIVGPISKGVPIDPMAADEFARRTAGLQSATNTYNSAYAERQKILVDAVSKLHKLKREVARLVSESAAQAGGQPTGTAQIRAAENRQQLNNTLQQISKASDYLQTHFNSSAGGGTPTSNAPIDSDIVKTMGELGVLKDGRLIALDEQLSSAGSAIQAHQKGIKDLIQRGRTGLADFTTAHQERMARAPGEVRDLIDKGVISPLAASNEKLINEYAANKSDPTQWKRLRETMPHLSERQIRKLMEDEIAIRRTGNTRFAKTKAGIKGGLVGAGLGVGLEALGSILTTKWHKYAPSGQSMPSP